MRTVCNQNIAMCLFVLFVSCTLGCVYVSCQSSSTSGGGNVWEIHEVFGMNRMIIAGSHPSDTTWDAVALSPDGASVAYLHTDFQQGLIGDKGRRTVEVREVRSSKAISTFQLPRATDLRNWSEVRWDQGWDQIQYCKQGKYILVSAGLGKVYVLDTNDYQPHALIDLNAVDLPAIPDKEVLGVSDHNRAEAKRARLSMGAMNLMAACSNSGSVAIFHMSGGRYWHGITKLFDLESGKEIPATDEFVVFDLNARMTISPSGRTAAIVTGGEIQIRDMKNNNVLRCIPLNGKHVASGKYLTQMDHVPLFAYIGDSIIALEIQGGFIRGNCNKNSFGLGCMLPNYDKPSLHFWDIRTGSEVQTIDDVDPGADMVEYLDVSADGRTVLAYTEKVHNCTSCNKGYGQVQVKDARFMLWNRVSGKPIAESPSLKVIHHQCKFMIITMGTCDTYDELPHLSMSQSGNAVIASWLDGAEPVTVYSLVNPSSSQ